MASASPSTVGVKLVWAGKTFDVVPVDKAAGVGALRATVASLTSVPPARQKLMSKAWKGVLKDDASLAALPDLVDGVAVTLMGSADAAAAAPGAGAPGNVVFAEDLSGAAARAAGVQLALPAGLTNTGNTCYANAVLQCLRKTPQLRAALTTNRLVEAFAAGGGGGGGGGGAGGGGAGGGGAGGGGGGGGGGAPAPAPGDAALVRSLGLLLDELDASPGAAVQPYAFLAALRAAHPQFAESTAPRAGVRVFKQQDADDLVTVLADALAQTLRVGTGDVQPVSLPGSRAPPNVAEAVLGLAVRTEHVCTESADEPPVVKLDVQRKLSAIIDGGARGVAVGHVADGLALGLKSEVEKRSDVLGRDAKWATTTRITRLPPVVVVQLIRFQWKRLSPAEVRDQPAAAGGVPCKILKSVSFPATGLDLLPFCDEPLKALLMGRRAKADAKPAAGGGGGGGSAGAPAPAPAPAPAAAAAAPPAPAAADATAGGLLGPGLGASFTGTYELYGVVSHKGRDSSSGHYIGWVRAKGDAWLVFDDDAVEETTTDVVLNRLKGGGDDFMAYELFYRAVV